MGNWRASSTLICTWSGLQGFSLVHGQWPDFMAGPCVFVLSGPTDLINKKTSQNKQASVCRCETEWTNGSCVLGCFHVHSCLATRVRLCCLCAFASVPALCERARMFQLCVSLHVCSSSVWACTYVQAPCERARVFRLCVSVHICGYRPPYSPAEHTTIQSTHTRARAGAIAFHCRLVTAFVFVLPLFFGSCLITVPHFICIPSRLPFSQQALLFLMRNTW